MGLNSKSALAATSIAERWAVPIAVLTMLLVFISALTIFIRHSSHFIADDFDHFSEILTKPLFELLLTPIDVHFAPLHQLSSFLIFNLAPLNFDAALIVMLAGWVAIVCIVHCALRRLTTTRAAWVITLLIGVSPVWIHNLIWWSSAAHRIPYLVLQAASIFFYLRFRDQLQRRDGVFCTAMQVVALGFYVKAILFPVILAALEVCLALQARKLSRPGVKLWLAMGTISAIYIIWYLFFAPVMRAPMGLGVMDTLMGSIQLLLRLGGLLLFLPIEESWSAWGAGIFWCVLAGLSIWRRPSRALPIAILIILLLVGGALTISGRAGLILQFPLAAMRYYLDELVIVAVFLAVIVNYDEVAKELTFTALHRRHAFVLLLIVVYPIGAYFSNRIIFTKAYENHQRTHDFMVNLERSLKEASALPAPPVMLDADFPGFAYGFMGSRRSMADILEAVYPRLIWFGESSQTQGRAYQIREDGQLALAALSDQPDFRDAISFPNWSIAEVSHRWSSGHHAIILISLKSGHKYRGELVVKGPVLGEQRVVARLNGTKIADLILTESVDCCSWRLQFNPALLRAEDLNIFDFELPDARKPNSNDQRELAIGIQKINIY